MFDKTKPPRVFSAKAPSEEFNTAVEMFFCHGSSRGYCDACGREYINIDGGGWDFEDNEVEEFRENMVKHPEWYIETDYTISVADNIMGRETVVGCKCNWLRKFEDVAWRYRSLVFNYVERRVKDELRKATQNQEAVDSAREFMEK